MGEKTIVSKEKAATSKEVSEWEVDPVCGMDVDTSDEEAEHAERNGTVFYFCSSDCRMQFEAAPSDFGA